MVGWIRTAVGAVFRWVSDKLAETYSVNDFSSFAAALSAMPAGGARLVVPHATAIAISVNTTVPKNVTLDVKQGCMFTIAAGVTLTFLGEVRAGGYEIFDGDGTVDLDNSASGYDLAWFKTTNGYSNERWDFAKRGMLTFRTKIVRFSKPREGQAGVLKSGNRLFRQFSAPHIFTDDQNAASVYVDCEFSAANDCAAFMAFDDAAKPENIYFYGPVQAIASASQNVPVGIDIKSGARICFDTMPVLNGFKTSMRIGSADMVAPVGSIFMPAVQCSFFSETGVLIHGQSGALSTQNIHIGRVNVTAAQVGGLNAVEMKGLLRDVEIGGIYYITDTAKNGYTAFDAANVLLLDSPVAGLLMSHCRIGGIYQANATNGLKITSTAGTPSLSDIQHITVERIFGKFNGSAADIDWCLNVKIDEVENSSDVTIGANAAQTEINTGSGLRTLTDNGAHTQINGLIHQTNGAGAVPSPANIYPIGRIVRETSDDRLYLRVAKTGAASDFLMLKGAASKGITGSRPTLGTNDIGYRYFDTTLAAAGKPISWTGTAWVDSTGTVV